MERFYIFVAVFDGYAVAEPHCFYFLCFEPFGGLAVHKESLILLCVGILGKRIELVGGVDDHDIPLAHFSGFSVEICCRDMAVRRAAFLEVHINASSDKGSQRDGCHIRPVVIMVIRALCMCAEMTHNVKIGMKIRNRAACVKTVQLAAAGFGCRIHQLGKVYHSHAIAKIINDLHIRVLLFYMIHL